MALVEYVLLVVLASVGAAVPDGAPAAPNDRTFDSDAIAQPSGGAAVEGRFTAAISMAVQATSGSPGKQTGGKKPMHHASSRRHRTTKGKHNPKPLTPKKDGGSK